MLDAFRGHPEAEVSGYDCAGCGVACPVTGGPDDLAPPVLHLPVCPHCGGRFGWDAYRKAHGSSRPPFAAELLAGPDAIGRFK